MKFIASVSAVLAACAMMASADVSTGPVWGYRANDPSMVIAPQWGEHWPACAGVRQSPIDIVTTPKVGKGKKSPLSFSGKCSQYNLTEPVEPLEVDVIGGVYSL
jgi:carbonic anhydrase